MEQTPCVPIRWEALLAHANLAVLEMQRRAASVQHHLSILVLILVAEPTLIAEWKATNQFATARLVIHQEILELNVSLI